MVSKKSKSKKHIEDELTGRGYPAPDGNVGNGDAVADNVARGGLGQVRVKSAVETTGLVDVAVNSVLDLLRCVSCIFG